MESISVVIPCKNEALNLPLILPYLDPAVTEVVIVDSFCDDDTVAVAQSLRPDVVVVRAGARGKGRALHDGMLAASGDIIVTMDADGSNDPAELPAMLDALAAGAQFVKGSRYLPGGGSADSTPVRDFGSRVICWVFNTVYRTAHTDLLYGYSAFRVSERSVLFPSCDGFEVEAVINANAARARLVVTEVPSIEAARAFGESNLHPLRDGVRITRAIVSEAMANGR